MSRSKQKQQVNLGSVNSNQPIELEEKDQVEETTETNELLTGEEVITPVAEEQVFNVEQEEKDRVANRTDSLLTESDIMPKLGTTAKMSLYGVLEYIKIMKENEGHILYLSQDTNYVVNDGPAYQVKLFRDIMDIITKTDDADFQLSMDFLMQLFRTEETVFSIYNLMRFQENIRLSPIELKCYPNLMTILTTLADPLTRQAKLRREFDLAKALEFGFSDAAKTRMQYYFSF